MDHLFQHLIIQQFKLAEVQTCFFKLMCGVIGPLKMYLTCSKNKTKKDIDHQYHFDDDMDSARGI